MQNGSSRSNATAVDRRVNRQFMVNVKGDQSVSTTAVKG